MIVEPDFVTHWKTCMLSDQLEMESAAHLVLSLWGHCQNRKSDRFVNLTNAALKSICRYRGDANRLAKALEDCGFIERHDDTLVVHDWAVVNAQLISNWKNGSYGGRPKKHPTETHRKPNDNPTITQTEIGLTQTKPIREDRIREDSSLAAKPPRGETKTQSKPRPPDELFDAVSQITASDPKSSGAHIGRVCKDLRASDSPYTAADVKQLASILEKRGFTLPITLGTVSKYIGWTRDEQHKVKGKTFEQTAAEVHAKREKVRLELEELEKDRERNQHDSKRQNASEQPGS